MPGSAAPALMSSQPGWAWLERLRDRRDALVASDAFRRWAARFPLTRPIARRRARALFDLSAGFVYAQVLAACVQLRLFDILAEGSATLPVLAGRTGLAPDAAQRLLTAATALRLVAVRPGGRFGLGSLGAAMVGNDGVAAMVAHHRHLYADLADPVALLQGQGGGALAAYWPYARAARPDALQPESIAAYSALMAASQPMVAAEVLDAYRLDRHRCLLDVGGGEGAFLQAAAARAPALQLMLFDLPAVAERAKARFMATGLASRAKAFGGDFLADALPQGADIISLVRVVHDHDDAAVLRLLRGVRQALPESGTLLLAEPLAETAGAETVGAYFSFYLLAMGQGRPRTRAELAELLAHSGFGPPRWLATATPMLARVLVARAC
jgi:demethylspheroidene O-methyltransferase